MQDDSQPRLAILGAGPIGLEAALYARYLGYPTEILERAAEPAAAVLAQPDEPLSTFGELASRLGVAALKAQDTSWSPPPISEPLTGRQWRERYLLALAESDLIADIMKLNTQVVAITRRDEDDDVSFQIHCCDRQGIESIYEADVIIDATGPFAPHDWFVDGTVDGDAIGNDLTFLNPAADYYIVGQKSASKSKFTFKAGLAQIRELFAILGEREDLDVYATLPVIN